MSSLKKAQSKTSLALLFILLIQVLVIPLLLLTPSVQGAATLTVKWSRTGQAEGEVGVLIADVNRDGREDVIRASAGYIRAYDGATGNNIWVHPDPYISTMAKPQMADLDGDGSFEIILNLSYGAMALRSRDGATYWYNNNVSRGNHWSSPVVGEVDGSGHPTVFVASEDVNGTNYGRLSALSYDTGKVLRQIWTWRPCFGGLSLADADLDGHVELFMGDRAYDYGDAGNGKGLRCFYAENLTVKWERREIDCSSHIPVVADVNDDGLLEIMAGQTGDFSIVEPRHGNFIFRSVNEYSNSTQRLEAFPIHFQFSVHDIDRDGNPEVLMADAHNETEPDAIIARYNDVVVWDLTLQKEDKRLHFGKCYYGPTVADVTGDGVMEFIACSYGSLYVFDSNYNLVAQSDLGPNTYATRLTYAVVQDIDWDGNVEIVVSSFDGNIWALEISGSAYSSGRLGQQRVRSEVQFYSERRCGAAEYVKPLGNARPMVTPSPSPPPTPIPTPTNVPGQTPTASPSSSPSSSPTSSPSSSDTPTPTSTGQGGFLPPEIATPAAVIAVVSIVAILAWPLNKRRKGPKNE